MNAPIQTLKAVSLSGNMHEVERIARAMEHTIICYRALPAYPENKSVRDDYLARYQGLCAEMMGALHG